jgi:Tol biopolymer transport system component
MFLRSLFLVFFLSISGFAAEGDAAKEARFLKNTRQLIYEGKRSGEGYFSTDGKRLIFQSEREEGNPFYQIYTLDFESGDSRRVSPGTGKTTCAFFQPGTDRVIFASTHEDPAAAAKQKAEIEFRASGKQRRYSWDYDAAMDIYSAKADGTDVVNITHSPGYDAEGSFSPDGKQIVFCSLRSAFPLEKLTPEQRARFEKDPAWWGDIYIMNADGANVRRLTEAPGYDGGPFFSPDGKRIVWRHFDESGMIADVWTMATDGSDKRRITDFKCMSWAPYFHPGGKYLIFTANKLGFDNFELFLVDAEGAHEPVRATFTPGFDGLPVFSPDGKKLAWASGRTSDGKSQIFLADWNDAEAMKAIEDYFNNLQPLGKPEAGARDVEISAKFVEISGGTKERNFDWMLGKVPSVGTHELKPEISAEDMKLEVGLLADDAHAGRATGSDGAKLAAEWLGEYFAKAGLQPLPDSKSFFQEFEFNAGERVIAEKSKLEVSSATAAAQALDKDFRPLAFSDNGEAEGEVVFAGYGLSVPEGAGQQRYNSYEGLDVKDKIVLILRYVPEDVEPARRAHLNRYSGLRYKAMMARERGAKAVLVVTGPNSPNAGELLPLSGDGSSAGSGIIAASISGTAADSLLAPGGKNLKDLQKALDGENPHAEGGFVLKNVKVKIAAGVEHIRKTDRNVIGCIPGETDEWIVVGAHYDHLGLGKGNSSLARAGEQEKIHPGADDNASGTSAVIEIAAALAQAAVSVPMRGTNMYIGGKTVYGDGVLEGWKPKRGIIFALWSGEEIGLIGSNSFVEKPPVDLVKSWPT